jgi:hypothetical protein
MHFVCMFCVLCLYMKVYLLRTDIENFLKISLKFTLLPYLLKMRKNAVMRICHERVKVDNGKHCRATAFNLVHVFFIWVMKLIIISLSSPFHSTFLNIATLHWKHYLFPCEVIINNSWIFLNSSSKIFMKHSWIVHEGAMNLFLDILKSWIFVHEKKLMNIHKCFGSWIFHEHRNSWMFIISATSWIVQ